MTLMTLNSLIALAIAFVALGSIKCMNGITPHSLRAAMVMVFVGAGGQALGFAAGAWDHYLDTLLYGGILALLIGNRRAPVWIPPAWSPRLAIITSMVTVVIVACYWTLE
jgi:uncharacterized membrane protein YwzB